MKNVFYFFVVIFLLNISWAFSETSYPLKDSVISVYYDTISLEAFLRPNSDGVLGEQQKRILQGDTVRSSDPQLFLIKLFSVSFKDTFPWSIVDYSISIYNKYYLSSYDIREAKVIKEQGIIHSYARSGEDIFPAYEKLFFWGVGLMIITFLISLFYVDKKTNFEKLMYLVLVLCGWVFCSLGASAIILRSEPSVKLLFFLAGIYALAMFIVYRFGKWYARRLRKKKLVPQNF